MLELTEEALRRLGDYDLASDPFEPPEIDVYSEEDLPKLVFMDGFQALAQIDTLVRNALSARRRRTSYFVVSGQSGTGRSAAAKFILNSYMRIWREVEGNGEAPLLIPKLPENHFGEYQVMKSWMSMLRVDPAKNEIAINKEVNAAFQGAIRDADENTYIADYGEQARAWAKELRGLGAAYAVCLEEVAEQKLLGPVKSIFDEVGTVCVITTNGKVVAENGWTRIDLSTLSGIEISDFIWDYWAKHTEKALPFNRAVVDGAFAKRTHPVRKIRTLMSAVLRHKLVLAPDTDWDAKQFQYALSVAEAGVTPVAP